MIHTNNPQQQQIIKAIAQLLNELSMDFDTFYKALRKNYVLIVNQQCKGTVRTALRCGIDRRIVADILNNKKLYHKRSILQLIINEIKTKIKAKNKFKNRLLPISGTNSLASIIKARVNGAATPNTVLDELVSMGLAEIHGNRFKFLDYPSTVIPERHKIMQQFAIDHQKLVTEFVTQMQMIRKTPDSEQSTKNTISMPVK